MSGTQQQLKNKRPLRVIWSEYQENMLLDLWQEKIDELRGARKNSHIFQEIAAKLEQAGFSGSWADVRTKVDNLTRRYRQEKNKIGPTGGAPSTWEHYHKVNNILGPFKIYNIVENMHESTDMSTLLDDSDIIELDPLVVDVSTCNASENEHSPEPRCKKKKTDVNAELIRLAQERNTFQKQMHEEKKQQMSEMMEKLDTISSQNAAFQSELLAILREKNK